MSTMNEIDVKGILATAQESISVQRVYGEPIERNGVTVIPAASVRGGGGGGGGSGTDPENRTGSGAGSGFGVTARPSGAFVMRGDDVVWRPAVDVERLALLACALTGLAVLALRSVLLRAFRS